MPYDGELMARAREKLARTRERNREEQSRRLAYAYERIPEIAEIDAAMRGQVLELVRLTAARSPKLNESAARLRDENLALQARRAELLVENGLPAEYLDEIFSCPLCRDSGEYKGRPCSCLERLYNAEMTEELSALIRSGDESFERFDLSLYPDRLEPGQIVSARETMAMVYESCRKFASDFPRPGSNLLFQGAAGLGKTYLSACIAREVSAKGRSVCYDTASAAFGAFEREKFSRDQEDSAAAAARVRRMLSCDLLILDDLGTELGGAVNTSALYTLVDSRLTSGKQTIISTNLEDDALTKRYSQAISSRILGEYSRLPFIGKDIRLIKKGM